MRMRWFLLALRLALPVTVPAAVPCTHLAMHHFLLQILGVAVIRMRWFGRLLRADMRVRLPSAELFLGDICDTSLALQSVSSAALLLLSADICDTSLALQSVSSAACLWLLLRTSVKWSGMEGQWIRCIDNPGSADFLHRYTSLTCLTLCTDGIATKFLRFWRCNGPCRSC